ncbi:MAG: hypothetical protein M3082_18395 [Candidatus Dormibacteraeota bacterium]|nr:hypothetical protein [Candidatus Dormibacteraeota bacterium]
MKNKEQPVGSASRTKSWWAAVLAGQVDEPHPIHGADLDVTFRGGKLRLSGELVSEEDRKQVVNEAREYVGKGVDEVDDKHLKVAKSQEKPGVLDQTLIAAFANRDVAEFARTHLVENRRVKPKLVEILEPGQQAEARKILPEAFMSDVEKAFNAGDAILVLRVDETSAFRVAGLLAQETRSLWTIATPPRPEQEPDR